MSHPTAMPTPRLLPLALCFFTIAFSPAFAQSGVTRLGEFTVNQVTTGDQSQPCVAGDGVGNAVVVWVGPDSDSGGIFARRIDSLGKPLASDIPVNETTTGSQAAPRVAVAENGTFIVVWQSFGEDEAGTWGVFARRFHADGTPQGSSFRVNENSTGDQIEPDVGIDGSGTAYFVWTQELNSNRSIRIRKFSAAGTPDVEGGITDPVSPEPHPSIIVAPDGRYAVAWTGDVEGDPVSAVIQMHAANGNFIARRRANLETVGD